jgi:hypothetical protein
MTPFTESQDGSISKSVESSIYPDVFYGLVGYMLMVVIVRSLVYWAFNRVVEKQTNAL